MRYQRNSQQEKPQAILMLIVANIMVYLLNHDGFFDRYFALCSFDVSGGNHEYWRFFTYMFIHAGFSHLFFNMYGLWLFGKLIEPVLGTRRFLIMYFFSGVLGGLIWQLCNMNSLSFCVGASGALFGVMVAAALAYPDAKFMLIFPPITMKLWVLVTFYCIYELFMTHSQGSSIAHIAHLGGALGGLLYMRRLGYKTGLPNLISNWWSKRKFAKATRNSQFQGSTDSPTNEDINRVLDRISQVGYDNLTPEELQILRRASEKLRQK